MSLPVIQLLRKMAITFAIGVVVLPVPSAHIQDSLANYHEDDSSQFPNKEESSPTANETVPAPNSRDEFFRETLKSYTSTSSTEQAVISVLEEFRDAFNVSDLVRIEGLLAADFERNYY